MNRIRGTHLFASLLVAGVLGAPAAKAELYKNVAQGLALMDFRFSGERNLLGDGITVNANAVYNNRKFDFGFAELTLNGQLNMTGGFTKRGIPGADFSMNTGGSPLQYNFRLNNGIQDLTATGGTLINMDSELNALGFYNLTLQVSNRGTFETDGVLGTDKGTLAYDVGPIEIKGNVIAEVLAAVTQPFFDASGTENPFAKFGNRAAKLATATKTVEDLQARAAAGEVLSDQELATLINNSVIAAVLGGKPSSHLFDNLFVPNGLLEGGQSVNARIVTVPEPSTLAFLGSSLVLGFCRRRGTRCCS